jgi:hypothetical protein
MKHLTQNTAKTRMTTIVSVLLLVVVPGFLSGCAATAKNPGVTTSREATAIWNSYEILPSHNYYYSGPDAQPFWLIGIDDRYHLKSELWKPVDLKPEILKSWINYKTPRVGYDPRPYGAYITGPNGERIGLWYSVRDWDRLGTASLGENDQVTVTSPPNERPAKSLFFFFKDD